MTTQPPTPQEGQWGGPDGQPPYPGPGQPAYGAGGTQYPQADQYGQPQYTQADQYGQPQYPQADQYGQPQYPQGGQPAYGAGEAQYGLGGQASYETGQQPSWGQPASDPGQQFGQPPAYGGQAYAPAAQPYPLQTGEEPGLDQPWYGIGFGAAVKRFFQKYAVFTGRASRGEFWWWALANGIVITALYIVLIAAGGLGLAANSGSGRFGVGVTALLILGIMSLWNLATLVPNLAITWRRLHDVDKGGPWYFILLVPAVGPIILIVLLAGSTNPQGAARFG
ncbi:MAG: DUF805 domain-containing protein [Bifidobacteriaceae bacterium]|jgi:uncharacterized membrane protein YhaH (DUF805 family)|nr:DUF805 domain-containing protein [Bifidobacteriaceae bacterium]